MPRPFIVFEGIDGSGKATQTRLLVEALEARGTRCSTIAFPRYGETVGGQLLKEALAGQRGDFVNLDARLASLPYALDRFESARLIRTELALGNVVIADRYIGSNQIHQGGKMEDETERLAYLDWLDHLEYRVLDIPRPDLILYLKAPVDVSLRLLADKRASKGGLLADGEKDQVENDRRYLDRSHAMANWLVGHYADWELVNCVDEAGQIRTREEIHADVLALVELFLT